PTHQLALFSLAGAEPSPPLPVPTARPGTAAAGGGPPPTPAWRRLAERRHGVLTIREAIAAGLGRAEIRRQVDAGAWQLHTGDVLVTQPGPLSAVQRVWCALVSIGPDAVVAGSAAAALGGLRGYEDPVLTVVLPSGRRVTPRPGVRIRATARLDAADVDADASPPRTALPRSVIDMAEWAASAEETRTILAFATASGIVQTGELREALARRGPISRRQVIAEALDGIDRDEDWVPELLYRRVEARFGLPPGRRAHPGARRDPRRRPRFEVVYEPWQLRVETRQMAAAGIRSAFEFVIPDRRGAGPTAPAAGGGPRPAVVRAGGLVPRVGGRPGATPAVVRYLGHPQQEQAVPRLVVSVPLTILREQPDRVGAAVTSALRQLGWPGPRAAAGGRQPTGGHRPHPARLGAAGPPTALGHTHEGPNHPGTPGGHAVAPPPG
ncbi:MAG: type IV toxin-antitoxin system AbiEi family antitoxin domain-containing protein, partial [Frankia sp.]|nr:type IV toxin-antitoxin system AbiEi family antitoxin domain-containing protein [Frankia sp.]